MEGPHQHVLMNLEPMHSLSTNKRPRQSTLQTLTRSDSAGFHQKWYTPPTNTVITLSSLTNGLAEISSGNWR